MIPITDYGLRILHADVGPPIQFSEPPKIPMKPADTLIDPEQSPSFVPMLDRELCFTAIWTSVSLTGDQQMRQCEKDEVRIAKWCWVLRNVLPFDNAGYYLSTPVEIRT